MQDQLINEKIQKNMEKNQAGLQALKLHFIPGCDASNNGYVISLVPLLTGVNYHMEIYLQLQLLSVIPFTLPELVKQNTLAMQK